MARRTYLNDLAELMAEAPTNVLLYLPVTEDLENVCDHLVVVTGRGVQPAGPIDDLIGEHFRLVGRPGDLLRLPEGVEVVRLERLPARRRRLTVRRSAVPIPHLDGRVRNATLDELVIAYLARPSAEGTGDGDDDCTLDGFGLPRVIP